MNLINFFLVSVMYFVFLFSLAYRSKKNKGSNYALDSEDLSDQKGSDLPTFRM